MESSVTAVSKQVLERILDAGKLMHCFECGICAARARLWKKMQHSGLDKQRLQLLWASAAEDERFASKMRKMKAIVENVKPEESQKAKKVFAKALECD